MARADVITLVTTLSRGQASEAAALRFYDEAVREIAATTDWLTQVTISTATVGTAAYALPTNAVRLLACFYDDRHLTPTDYRQAVSTYGPLWRGLTGTPAEFLMEGEAARTVRLVPAPALPSDSYIPTLGSIMGMDYPGYNIATLHTETRTDVPVWMELYLALVILAREYARASTHRNTEMSAAWAGLAAIVRAMIS